MTHECPWCDGEKVVCLGENSWTDFFSCPLCVGLCKEFLNAGYISNAEETAKSLGVTIKWKNPGER